MLHTIQNEDNPNTNASHNQTSLSIQMLIFWSTHSSNSFNNV